MSSWLVALTGLAYLGVAIDQSVKHNYPMALVYVGYTLGNVGFFMALK